MKKTSIAWLTVALVVIRAIGYGVAPTAAPIRPSSASNEADGANWQAYGRTYSEDHYSPLAQINDANVGRLGLAWSYDIEPVVSSFSAPLEVDGVLYFAAGHSIIHAVDARTGKLLWRYDPEVYKVAGEKLRAGWGIRGIAFMDGKVFAGCLDGRLIALDAKNGKLLWSAMTIDPKDSRYITGPPWAFRGKVVIGHGGGDYAPVRGYITAYDANSGKKLWRFYTVPGDPKKGFENAAMAMAAKTWKGKWWKDGGGGTVWHAMAYDPKFNRLYFGTGNAEPWNPKLRGNGDNLFTASIVAVDADTGKYAWHYQLNPNEGWDYDNTMDIELADLNIGGKTRSVILHAPKNGFFYVLDRATGKLISAEKYAKATWADRIDLKTGRPVEDPAARYVNGQPAQVYPSVNGAHNVQAMSFNPKNGLVYIPAMDGSRVFADAADLPHWRPTYHMFISNGTGAPKTPMPVPPQTSSLLAWDPVKQKAVWNVPLNGPWNGGTMTTGGNLVVQGESTGYVSIYAADTGKKLWSFYAQNGILAQPITYSVGKRQYITIITGWRSSMPTTPNWDFYTQKRRVLTFALDAKGALPAEDKTQTAVVDDPKFAIDPAKADIGKGIYNSNCAVCHGIGMISGGAAPDLRKSNLPLSLEALTSVVRDGALAPQGMGRFEEFTPQQLEGIQHYIRQRARETSVAAK